jgi:hypothetical protein
MNFGVIIVIAIIAVKIWDFISGLQKGPENGGVQDFSGRGVSPSSEVEVVKEQLRNAMQEHFKNLKKAKEQEEQASRVLEALKNQKEQNNKSKNSGLQKTSLNQSLKVDKGFLATAEGTSIVDRERANQGFSKKNNIEESVIDLDLENMEEVRRAFIYSEVFQRKY